MTVVLVPIEYSGSRCLHVYLLAVECSASADHVCAGGAIHTQLLAFNMLTERERNVQKDKAKELLRFMQVNGFRGEG